MKRFLMLMVLLMMMLPVMAQDDLPQSRDAIRIQFDSIEFTLPTALAGAIDLQIIPEKIYEEGMPPWTSNPETLQITFNNYSNGAEAFHTPRILIYKLEADMSRFGSAETGFTGGLNRAITFFNTAPDLTSYIGNEGERLPLLPIANAAQVIRAKPEYIASEQIVGVRYITYYAQGAAPVADKDIFYTFQGLSMDGQYYISIIMPISSGQLPEVDTMADDFDYAAFSDNIMNYMAETAATLHALDDGAYTPSLPVLDNLVLSIQIIPPEQE